MSTESPSSPMPKLTFTTGGVLVVVGLIGYIGTGFASVTAMIPAFIGVLLLISGWIAVKKLMLGIHIALVVALIGALGMFMPLQDLGALFAGDADNPPAVIAALVSLIVLLVYLVLGVRSFVAARRWKNS
ncbi:hypothetical protein [Garicola koreensis]|uniref:Uncharacterized protein n=1 Tax=Garicola koreensis TaxID=1262554 RepID=A0A7W5TSQ8_9MICC|nr:hypothetical protein [Garicola koreensis]MBB3667962.1 hypothetical protein [Garicola koreensis]